MPAESSSSNTAYCCRSPLPPLLVTLLLLLPPPRSPLHQLQICTLFSTDSGDAAAAAAATISSHSCNTQHTALLKPIIILHHIPHTHCYFPRLSVSFSLSSPVSHSLALPLSLSQQQNTNSLRRQSLSLALCDQAQRGEKNCFQLNEIFEEIYFPDFLIPCLVRSLLFHPILVEEIIAMVRIKACASNKFVERASERANRNNQRTREQRGERGTGKRVPGNVWEQRVRTD